MLVLFLYPPETDAVASYLPQMNNETGIGIKPPLGVLHVATYIQATTSHEVKVIDGRLVAGDYANIADLVGELKADIVGITAWTDFWFSVTRVIEEIKIRLPSVFVVVGGPHTLMYPQEVLDTKGIDAIVVGDGEVPMARLLECLEAKKPRHDIPGLHFKETGVHAEVAYYETDLTHIPPPDRTLLPISKYTSVLGKGQLTTTMITSRGCPYSCVFCKIKKQKPLQRSAAQVIAEFAEIHRLGIAEVEVYDDTFTWSHKRVREICLELIRRNYGIIWAVRDRVSNVREETLDLMRRAGCTRIHYGIESGSNRILKRVKKGITVEEAERAVSLARQAGFEILTFFMFGLPGETRADIQATIDLSRKLDADYCQYSITIPYPGTEMYLEGLAGGLLSTDFWRDFTLHPRPDFQIPTVSFCEVPFAELLEIHDRATRSFYFRPAVIFRELRKLRSLAELKRKVNMGLALLR
jgi:anaerobic magnesium-protoporphyrin IX monomethyl ester cyclase